MFHGKINANPWPYFANMFIGIIACKKIYTIGIRIASTPPPPQISKLCTPTFRDFLHICEVLSIYSKQR